MSLIIKRDSNGVKPLLQTGEFGYDNYPAGGDSGRVYVGTGSVNIPLAKKEEMSAVDGKADVHIARVDNPHGVTKAQVGLGNADNTSDNVKNVLSAIKWTTARTITLSGYVSGSASVDGSANVTITTAVQPNSVALGTDTTGNYMADTIAGSGISVSHTPSEGSTATITNSAPNVTTNITTTHNSANVIVNSSDGTDGTINSATQTLAGVMSAADKTKLDGIEVGATADQTGAEIKALYESNANTNALTDSLLTLLTTKKVKNVSTDALKDKLVITYTDDTVSNLNINDSITDIHVSGATLDATTNVLTLTSTDGGADVIVDLSDFVNSSELTTALNTTVKLTGNQTIADVKTFSSTIGGSITGNAGTATKLQTARTINGVAFDGTANIVVSDATAVNLTGDQTIAGIKTFSSDIVGNISGNAGTATKLSTNRTNFRNSTDSVVVGELMWKNYGNNHTIFDASNSTTPTGAGVNNINPDVPWTANCPTLMGYNGTNTYGVRVDSSRCADKLSGARTITLGGGLTGSVNFDGSSNVTLNAQVNGLGTAATTAATDYAKSKGRVVNDGNLFLDSGMYGINGEAANTFSIYGAMIVANNSDTGLQISGGYNSDNLWFRGWNNYGAGFTPWRKVYHTGNTIKNPDGTIKASSPVINLYTDKHDLHNEPQFGATPAVVRKSKGVYEITGTLGLRSEGWYVDTPNDRNGNKYFNIEWTQNITPDAVDGVVDEYRDDIVVTIETFERVWNKDTGMFDNGNPVDINDLQNRFVQLRFNEIKVEQEVPNG